MMATSNRDRESLFSILFVAFLLCLMMLPRYYDAISCSLDALSKAVRLPFPELKKAISNLKFGVCIIYRCTFVFLSRSLI